MRQVVRDLFKSLYTSSLVPLCHSGQWPVLYTTVASGQFSTPQWPVASSLHHSGQFSTQRHLKPFLNWANVCSPNILRTLRRTMIRFLIELLVCRTWFGQSKLYFVLNWHASFGPNLRQTRSRQHDRKCRLKSSQVNILSSSLTG